ncbi:MAG: hypothetical protein CXR31_11740 [Geobacter sp.]|nr:MAG: hypothetical protein CXR31_11740 [Geobacter sp.]
MALISKSDLYYKDYKWTAYPDDDPKITGKPDSTLFNRHEGYEVLYLINKFAEKHDFKQKPSGTKLEKMIRNELPSTTRGQENVTKWLEGNWNTKKY